MPLVDRTPGPREVEPRHARRRSKQTASCRSMAQCSCIHRQTSSCLSWSAHASGVARERIVPVAHVGALRDEAPDHGEIAGPGGPMHRRAVVDADHVPVAVLLEQEIHGVALLADVGEEHRQPDRIALGHRLAAPPRARPQPPFVVEGRAQQVHPSQCRRGTGRPPSRRARSSSPPRAAHGWRAGRPGRPAAFRSSVAPRSRSRSISGPETPASLACLLVMSSPIVVAAVGAERRGIHVGPGVQEQPRDLDDVLRRAGTAARDSRAT